LVLWKPHAQSQFSFFRNYFLHAGVWTHNGPDRTPTSPGGNTVNQKVLALVVAAVAFSGTAFAQQTQPAPQQPAAQTPKEGSVNDRRADQQQRIANGVRSGQLTAGETGKLETREAKINHQVRADRKASGGKLTPQEHKQINREQNRASRQIYRDKHNGVKAPK
jgi:hypothetical protein